MLEDSVIKVRRRSAFSKHEPTELRKNQYFVEVDRNIQFQAALDEIGSQAQQIEDMMMGQSGTIYTMGLQGFE
jgi:hypothetical protein